MTVLTLTKGLGRGRGNFTPPPCGFSKTVFSRKRVKPCFFVTFDNIINHTLPENVIEIRDMKILLVNIN